METWERGILHLLTYGTVAETKAVVVAIYRDFGTVVVEGDDGVVEQQDGFLTPPKKGELLVQFVRL